MGTVGFRKQIFHGNLQRFLIIAFLFKPVSLPHSINSSNGIGIASFTQSISFSTFHMTDVFHMFGSLRPLVSCSLLALFHASLDVLNSFLNYFRRKFLFRRN